MADHLGMTASGIYEIERADEHHCPRSATVTLLRITLQDPILVARLQAAGVPHPFPDDCVS